MSEPAGVLRVDKPEGPTSHDVVAAARRALGVRRIGHTGTLDPFASGLLLLCVDWATRLAEFLSDLSKTYLATIRLGSRTDTDDRTGAVLAESATWRSLSTSRIEEAFVARIGPQLQTPPAYSAKKVAGERSYRRARRGEQVDLPPVAVVIHDIRLQAIDLPDVRAEVTSSSGTYIRALARDIGEELGCGAHLAALRRTRIGDSRLDGAVAMADLGDGIARARARISPAEALSHLPRLDVAGAAAESLRHGRAIEHPGEDADRLAVFDAEGLIGVADRRAAVLRPRKILPRA